jgi:hypothetical protein
MNDLFIPLQLDEGELIAEPSNGAKASPEAGQAVDEFETEYELDDDYPETVVEHAVTHKRWELRHVLDHGRMVILGHPGSGKTTVAKHFAYTVATGATADKTVKDLIPVVVKAAEYALALKDEPSLSFYHYVTRKHSDRFGSLFEWALKRNRCWLIVDGLDEVPDVETRVTATRRIEQIVSEFPQNRYLVTSRIIGYRQNRLAGNFVHATLVDFDGAQVTAFLKQWYRAVEVEADSRVSDEALQERADDLWKAIRANLGIAKLAGNPLLLTIIALANWRGTKLPSRRVELYQIASETLIENWPLEQRHLHLNMTEILSILEPIAHFIFRSGKNNLVTEHELRPLFEAQVSQAQGKNLVEARAISRELLQTIEEHTGFFLEKGFNSQHQRVYGFLHLTFAEYLTARYLAEQWSGGELELAEYVHDSRWHEVVLLMAGHVGTWAIAQATRLVSEIVALHSAYEDLLQRDMFLAAEILADNVRVKRELQDAIVGRLIALALNHPLADARRRAAHLIWEIARFFPLGEPALSLTIDTSNESDAMKSRRADLRAMLGDDSDSVFKGVIESLASARPSDEVFDLLDSHQDGDAGQEGLLVKAGRSMMMLAVPPATADRIRKLEPKALTFTDLLHADHADLRPDQCLWLLSPTDIRNIGYKRVTRLLANLRDDDWPIRSAVVAAMELQDCDLEFGRELVKVAVSSRPAKERKAALSSVSLLVGWSPFRRRAQELVYWTGTLASKFFDHTQAADGVRTEALRLIATTSARALSWGGNPEPQFVEMLARVLNEPDVTVRLAALDELVKYGIRGLAAPIAAKLIELLDDSNPRVWEMAARILIRRGGLDEGQVKLLIERGFGDRANSSDVADWLEELLLLSGHVHSPVLIALVEDKILQLITRVGREVKRVPYWPVSIEGRVRPLPRLATMLSAEMGSAAAEAGYLAVLTWLVVRAPGDNVSRLLSLIRSTDKRLRENAIRWIRPSDLSADHVVEAMLAGLDPDDPRSAYSISHTILSTTDLRARDEAIEQLVDRLAATPADAAASQLLWDLFETPSRGFRSPGLYGIKVMWLFEGSPGVSA